MHNVRIYYNDNLIKSYNRKIDKLNGGERLYMRDVLAENFGSDFTIDFDKDITVNGCTIEVEKNSSK